MPEYSIFDFDQRITLDQLRISSRIYNELNRLNSFLNPDE